MPASVPSSPSEYSSQHADHTRSAYRSSEGIRKRPRVSQACTACRNRKTRCDGHRPVCNACQTRGIEADCKYAEHSRRQRGSDLISSPAANGSASQSGTENNTSRHTLLCSPKPSGFATATSIRTSAPAVPYQPWSSTQSDGLATFSGQNEASVYGPSSTVAFLRHVVASDGDSQRTFTPGSRMRSPPRHVPERVPERNDGRAVLPRRRSADNFLSCYWEFIHPMFPVLHRPDFCRKYEKFWLAESAGTQADMTPELDAENTIFLSTMNLVFALGSKFSDLIPAKQKTATADEFYQKSRQLFAFDALDSASLHTVQMLVLIGVYLQSTQHANRCWNSIGLAIRVAQGLGLHLETDTQRLSQVESEMRRRIWYTCVNLDRLLAMTFGRPTMIHNVKAVTIPEMIDDEYLSNDGRGVQPPEVTSQLGLFVSSCTLFELLEEVLKFLSENEPAARLQCQAEVVHQRAGLVTRVLDLNRRLDDFSATVPSYLRPSVDGRPPVTRTNQINLQQQVLYCRFLLTRLLLLRPLLLLTTTSKCSKAPMETLDGSGQTLLDNEMIRRCCDLCVQTAYRLVETIHRNLGTLYRSSGWHAVYFTFSAAIVLLGSLKCDVIDIQARDSSFENCWARCLDILHHYTDQVQSAASAIHSLNSVREQILRKKGPQERQSTAVANDLRTNSTSFDETTHQNPQFWPNEAADSNDPFSIGNLPGEYFGPQLTNLDWLELFQTQP